MRMRFITPLVGFCWFICFKDTHFSSADKACEKSTVCPSYAICEVISGGYRCACKRGSVSSTGEWYFTDKSVTCQDIDECAQDPTRCGPNASCSNTDKSFVCECVSGYRSSRRVSGKRGIAPLDCSDIDECSQDPSPCGPNSICINMPGSYTCTCQPGYLPPSQLDSPFSCTDIDECSQDPSPCGPNSICTNTPGSYTCTCREGYFPPSLSGAPFSCKDIDECSHNPSPCGPNSICRNTLGRYTCTCQAGYLPPRKSSTPFSCTDIDECSRDPSPCGPNSICTNTPGSYTCTCRAGYLAPSQVGSPFSCTEVTSKCRAHFLEENDLVRKSQNQSLDTAHGSSPEDAAYCTLLKSTFRTLGEPCKEKISTVCLEKAAGGFASILEQTSSWSNLSTEQLSVSATIVLHSVERIVMDILTNPTENRNLTFRTEELDVQMKVIGNGCSSEDSVVSLGAKGESMEISCRMVQESTAQGTSSPPADMD